MKASIIIRTYNEAKHLPQLLSMIQAQKTDFSFDVTIVDSGSTDGTLTIAKTFACHIVHIAKEQFSFGRSLNVGCQSATGDILVFISGHCIPTRDDWLTRLLAPIIKQKAVLSYGRQVGNHASRFSEQQVFAKYFKAESAVPQQGFFCNNANAALLKTVWQQHQFNEELTGLEDMHLAKRLQGQGMNIAYVADASVYHLHDESWRQVKRRYEREAIALQYIIPEVQISVLDMVRYTMGAISHDYRVAAKNRVFLRNMFDIIAYRTAQYLGSYLGNHMHKKLSRIKKEQYFYPH